MDICGTAFLKKRSGSPVRISVSNHSSEMEESSRLVVRTCSVRKRFCDFANDENAPRTRIRNEAHCAAVGFFAVRSRNRRLPRYRMISSTEHRIQPMGYASATETKPMFRLFVMNR